MIYNTFLINESEHCLRVTLNRPGSRNSLNGELVEELANFLDCIWDDRQIKLIIIEGRNGFFCTGMDFEEMASSDKNNDMEARETFSRRYMEVIKKFTLIPKVIVSKVDGQVMAGGIGIAAASDFVVATPGSQFSLSEALWGIIPAMVMPFLIRRVGFQAAYRMALTALPVYIEEAKKIHLVDEIGEDPDTIIKRLCSRLIRMDTETIKNIKAFFRNVWIVTNDMEDYAVNESCKHILSEKVQQNITNFVRHKKFPWEGN